MQKIIKMVNVLWISKKNKSGMFLRRAAVLKNRLYIMTLTLIHPTFNWTHWATL